MIVRRTAGVLARAASSAVAVVALSAPPLASAFLAWSGVLPPEEVVAARSVRAWAWAAVVAVALLAVRALVERRPARALAGAALLALAQLGTAILSPRLDVSVDSGVGEEPLAWRIARAPPGTRPPELEVLEIPEQAGAAVRLRMDGSELLAVPGRTARAGSLSVSAEPHAAPLFSLRRASGVVEGEGLLKLAPGPPDYFQVALLPHRFYVSVAASPPGAPVALPDRLHLRVQRGKVKLLDQDVLLREAVHFEGLSLRFDPGARWARVRVRSVPPRSMFVVALALAAGAGGAAWRGRRRA